MLCRYRSPCGLHRHDYACVQSGVSPSTLSRLLKGDSGISPEMSLRLSKVLGRTPESWLAMQDM
ncbi:MAG: HigA family addiction module antidote protein [Halomonas sp.]|nr:HigA family addiction module antidote protein [Halomonas sp.]